ncbi:MAG: ATP-dependent DNA helicase RecG [Vallitaleaceae bacterium]|nr:ATP-dependent DNA helicase RecG [Vallitaleaceae bacterium]
MNTLVPITVIKGIGEKISKLLSRVGIKTIDDLIHYFPRDYEARKDFTPIVHLQPNAIFLVKGEVCEAPQNMRKKSFVVTTLKLKDETGQIGVTWFRQPYLKNKWQLGDSVILKGRVVLKYGHLQLESPQVLTQKDIDLMSSADLLPIYPLSKDISTKMLTDFIQAGLNYTGDQLRDPLPFSIKESFNLCEYNYALHQIHRPVDHEELAKAIKRLTFDEFLTFQLGLQMLKNECFVMDNQYSFVQKDKVLELFTQLPYQLTKAQLRVWEEIQSDLEGPKTMNRLVQGDVGSGKTVLAILALVYAVNNGYQGTMMAPTEVLAKQHYQSLQQLLTPFGIEVGLLVGSMTKKQKQETAGRIAEGSIHIVIGTHAIIQDAIQFNNLALVITDEQHRFGVRQREKLSGKGHYPHVLVMSATPIPRTLALIVYGDMDVSLVDELPPGRQVIKTYHVNSSYRPRIYQFLEKEINNGRQVYVVCPMVDENEELELESVVSYSEKLKEVISPSIRMTYLHGKMKPKEKNDIMESFSLGEIDLLVSTTVIEVGVNVPNATIMVIENAERFGLAGLHQLRGRVGRGIHQSYCILITDSKADITKKRLDVLEKYTDGFIISEYDLKLRGPGDAFGIKQHGLPEFRIGNIFENMDLLKETSELAKKILKEDPLLENEAYRDLKDLIAYELENKLQNINL